jgi:uncharacterized protein YhhL (DUF1145 family)
MKFDLPKILLSIVWLLIFAGLLDLLPEKYAHPLQFLGGLLTVAHLIEYVIFYKKIAARPESPIIAFVMNIFFGLFYWKSES